MMDINKVVSQKLCYIAIMNIVNAMYTIQIEIIIKTRKKE